MHPFLGKVTTYLMRYDVSFHSFVTAYRAESWLENTGVERNDRLKITFAILDWANYLTEDAGIAVRG